MTISEMFAQSGILTLLGMAVVFSFLIIMILAMKLLHVVLHGLGMDKDKEPATAQAASPARQAVAPAQDTGAIVAAIAAAVREKQSV